MCVSTTFAGDLSQLYEKAYFLETAKGQTEAALEIYRRIAATEPIGGEKDTTIKALKRLIEIYTVSTLPEDTDKELYEKAAQLQKLGRHVEAIALFEKLILPPRGTYQEHKDEPTRLLQDSLISLFLSIQTNNDQKKMAEVQARLLKDTDCDLDRIIHALPDGGTLYLPSGIYTLDHSGISVDNNRSITIRGAEREKCIIERTSDTCMIWVARGGKMTMENLTLRSQLAALDKEMQFEESGCALLVQDSGTATLTNCTLQAAGPIMRCPSAVKALGFAEIHLFNCSFSGYAIPVYFGEGSNGTLSECRIEHSLRMNEDTIVKVSRTIFHDAKYEAIGFHGGQLNLDSCLIINAKSAVDLELGSRADQLHLFNSAVINCDQGLPILPSMGSGYGPFLLNNNVFVYNKELSAESRSRNLARTRQELPDELTLSNNIFYAPVAHIWGNMLLTTKHSPKTNTFWSSDPWDLPNGQTSDSLSNMLIKDPEFKNAALGNFTTGNTAVQSAGHGLSDPAIIQALWATYEETCK
jgi:hypothetical protein